ncbi:MAG: hypothetical protein MUE92_01285 [Chloroflexi bacterium]|nr:hypothetical protein [Chloroflexota bacterium]
MTDTLTESFCERCGTRYSFDQTAKPRRGGLGRVRVLTRGLKNYVVNDGLPMAEAMAAARDEESRAGTVQQLDAFHAAFNFCMTCRQYTCANCWNAKAGECLTCAPDLAREVLPAPFPDLPAAGPVVSGNGHAAAEAMVWPVVDLERGQPGATPADEAIAREPQAPLDVAEPEVDLSLAAEPAVEEPAVLARLDAFVAAPDHVVVDELTADELAEIETALAATHPVIETPAATDAEMVLAASVVAGINPTEDAVAAPEAGPEAAPEPQTVLSPAAASAQGPAAEAQVVDEVETGAAPEAPAEVAEAPATELPVFVATPVDPVEAGRSQTRSLLGRFRPGHSAAPRPEADEAAAALALAAAAQAAPAPAPAVAEEPVPVVAEEPAPVVAEEPAPAAAEEPAPPAAEPAAPPAPADSIEQPTWRVVAPDAAQGPAAPAAPTTPSDWPAAPAWPTNPSVPRPNTVPGPAAAPWAARLATARPEPTGVWAASSQEVLLGAPAGAQQGAPAIQACVSCGLSLSANARFCRRCGTRQA